MGLVNLPIAVKCYQAYDGCKASTLIYGYNLCSRIGYAVMQAIHADGRSWSLM